MTQVRFLVLGAAAGGGLPQWNCGCPNCRAARDPASGLKPQTQSSLAVSPDGERWVVFNASPDIRAQIEHNACLHPRALRDSPIASVVITNGDIDHITGLLTLREKQAFTLHATPALMETLGQNPVFQVLDPAFVQARAVGLDIPFSPLPGLEIRLFAVPGKVPLYLEGDDLRLGQETDDTVGVEFRIADRRAYYVPGCGSMPATLSQRLEGADLVFFDGTVFEDDEMVQAGVGQKTGRRMGHMPINGDGGSLAALSPLSIGRKIFIHINNTNPIWRPGAQRAAVEARGFEIGHDGMEVILAAQP
ncbi:MULTISPECIES: pyrroloquinoline quinone biosynthesis protein PqqB [Alphaproteobacteria]|uniref:Coenzyme PQQ synthesis protein B n=2 Tax=Alphaproteobacteria TaxID=28211 RepID=A0A512HFA6_9HYPH|nr:MULTISPECIES: pyrroloquinoline quinone biosynthesis protein PqqB [Alphaproteobacteria]GEO84136.1 coenzyme PQQ synthesis protein B [Ciceribacter naphthalenivorans]GLR24672.1 coenzyme PQQ synthesis protein B [Ciceribacter naphthalenivorans]GLT07528.1 coenzyme PQQ synthesis protein B [Sphingomonas psychrolutea]